MKIDVIIPTYRPGEELRVLLRGLESQTLPVHRIILMNTRAGNFPADLERDFPGVEVHHLEKKDFDHGGTRDRAARLSGAEYLLYMTQDALPADERLVEELAKCFADERVKAA